MNRYKSIILLSCLGGLFTGIAASCSSRQAASCFKHITLQHTTGFPTEEPGIEQGVSACYAGVLNGQLLLAGGCNFPETPATEGGKKRYYQGIYATDITVDSALTWRKVGNLPSAAAYGVSIAMPQGLICVGGNNENGAFSSVFRLSLSTDLQSVQIDTLPSLPFAMDNSSGTLVGQSLYVAGGNVDGKPSNAVLTLDLAHLENGWRQLADFPGPPRVQPICVGQTGEGTPRFYLWGGFAAASGDRPASLSTNGYCYSVTTEQWQPAATPARADSTEVSLGGGMGIALNDSLILCTGGVNKDIFLAALQREALMKQAVKTDRQQIADSLKAAGKEYMLWPAEKYGFNDCLLLYNTRRDTWKEVKQAHEFARAGAAIAGGDYTFFIINGELKPGIRTPQITKLNIEP